MTCTNKKLSQFSWRHFTYINQIFGDINVRDIITEIYPKRDIRFNIALSDSATSEIPDTHHTIWNVRTNNLEFCSVMEGIQDIDRHINDNLCQSYTLMKYLSVPILAGTSNHVQRARQMDMIQMYREKIINHPEFISKMGSIIYPGNRGWRDYTIDGDPHLRMYKTRIFKNIKKVLDEWEEYGYWYFIGNGKCPKKKR